MQGKIKLEVIAEGTLFTPWESSFIVETNKKVSVNEVYDPDSGTNSTKKIRVIVEEDEKEEKIEQIIKEEPHRLNKHIEILNDLIKLKKVKKDKFDKVFETYEALLATKGSFLSENEIKYIKNKIII